jgi:uncharacterized membrane protein
MKCHGTVTRKEYRKMEIALALIYFVSAALWLFVFILVIIACFKIIAMNRTTQNNSFLFRKILSAQQKQLELTQWMCDNAYQKQNGVR